MMDIILIISLILIGLSITVWLRTSGHYEKLKWSFRLDAATTMAEDEIKGPPITLSFGIKVPRRISIQESIDLTLNANPTFEPDKVNETAKFEFPPTKVEVELQAAAFDIGGEPRQMAVITRDTTGISFRWIISPKGEGTHILMLIARKLDQYDNIFREIDYKKFNVEVTNWLGLTRSQARLVGSVIGFLGILGTIFGILGFFK